jgi:hypothetical protein
MAHCGRFEYVYADCKIVGFGAMSELLLCLYSLTIDAMSCIVATVATRDEEETKTNSVNYRYYRAIGNLSRGERPNDEK